MVNGGCRNINEFINQMESQELFLVVKTSYDESKKIEYFVKSSKVQNSLRAIVISNAELNVPFSETSFYLNAYDNWKKGADYEALKKKQLVLKNTIDLKYSEKIVEAILRFKQLKKTDNESIIKNFSIKLLSIIDRFTIELEKTDKYKFVIMDVKNLHEYLIALFLFDAGNDVLICEISKSIDSFAEYKKPVRIEVGDLETNQNRRTREGLRSESSSPRGTGEITTSERPRISLDSIRRTGSAPAQAASSQPQGATSRQGNAAAQTARPIERQSPITARTQTPMVEKSYEELANLARSVVMIKIYDKEGEVSGSGSGIMIGRNGFILTNNHVIEHGKYYSVIIEGEENESPVTDVIKCNRDFDLAIIRIDRELLPLPMYGGNKLVRGQKVVAIGSPLGLFNSVSDGIISGFRRMRDMDVIQFTAPTSPGSSGGALLNMYGEVIGICTAGTVEGQNINLAVPYDTIRPFVRGFV